MAGSSTPAVYLERRMTELERVAYHEAGHAVAMVLYGIRFERATIVEDEDVLGRVRHEYAPEDIPTRTRGRMRSTICAHIPSG